MHYIHTGQAPQYRSNCVSMISSSGNRCRLRSCDTADYILPRTRTKFGERGFHWNTLPSDLHDITDTNAFKKRLKTVLFDRTYWLIIVVVRRSSTVRKAAPCKSLIVFVLYCIVRAHVWPRSDTIHVIIVCDWNFVMLTKNSSSLHNEFKNLWYDAIAKYLTCNQNTDR